MNNCKCVTANTEVSELNTKLNLHEAKVQFAVLNRMEASTLKFLYTPKPCTCGSVCLLSIQELSLSCEMAQPRFYY